MVKNWKKITTLVCATAILAGTLASCGGTSKKSSINKEKPVISIMTMAYAVESAPADGPVMKALEEYLGVDLDIQFIPSSGYGEKVTAAMGSGTYPHVMLVGERNSSVIQNCRAGTFWEIGDKLKNYPNLSQANPVILNNMSIDGKTYGIYRGRILGRNGMTIRKDWVEKVGLKMPQTIDEFYNVLKAFKEKDPDGNGKDDTFGMIMTKVTSSFDNLAIWFGAPNKWGVGSDGNLQPAFLTEEYFNTVKFMKKLYDEKLINQDYATYDGGKWDDQFLSSKAGVIIDVTDRGRRIATNIAKVEPKAEIGVLGYLKKDANTPPKTLPTTGYAGFFVFPKSTVTSEEDLDIVLKVMDKMQTPEAANIMNLGIKDRNYTVTADGYAKVIDDPTLKKEFADLNQLGTFSVKGKEGLKTAYTTPVAKIVDDVIADNENYIVPNPAEPFVSDTYSRKGPQLDAIISEANTKFIVGQITEEQYKAELERWKSNGGTEYIKEINDQYQKVGKVK